MDSFKRHFTEEAFLFSTFVEFNKCWSSGKRSRLVIESVNGHAFVNFSAFLGNPKTMHSAPGENRYPRRKSKKKSKKKSKRKTQRDNDRAARFQEKKHQEREASSVNPPSPPPAPSAVSSSRMQFTFAEPDPADMSEDSNFSKMNVDGNVTSASVSDNLPPESEDSSKTTATAMAPVSQAPILEALKALGDKLDATNKELTKYDCYDSVTTVLEEIRNPPK